MGLAQTLTITINGKDESLELNKLHMFHDLIIPKHLKLVDGSVILDDETIRALMVNVKNEIFETRRAANAMAVKYPKGFRLGDGPQEYHDTYRKFSSIQELEDIILFFKSNSPKSTDDVSVTYSFSF